MSTVLFVLLCWYVVALHYRQLSTFAIFHPLLRHPIIFSAMPKVKDGRKGGPPKVRHSARGGRPSPDADALSELRAANDMLRQQLQQARTLTSEPVAGTSSAPDEQATASFETQEQQRLSFAPLDVTLPHESSALHNATAAVQTPTTQDLLSSVLQQMTAQTAVHGEQSAISPFLVLGSTLDPKIKAKIWEGVYVELGGLSSPTDPTVSVAVSHDGQQPSVSLTPVKAKPPGNIIEWLRLFATYMCVYLQTHASEAPSMLTYMVNILDMHRRHGGFAWRVYDERFRRVRALAPSMPWHVTNWDLAMDAVQTVVVRQSDTLQQPFRFGQRPNQQPARGPSAVCFAYNGTGKCGRTACHFAHVCANCGRKGHPRIACRIGKNAKTRSGPTHPGASA